MRNTNLHSESCFEAVSGAVAGAGAGAAMHFLKDSLCFDVGDSHGRG